MTRTPPSCRESSEMGRSHRAKAAMSSAPGAAGVAGATVRPHLPGSLSQPSGLSSSPHLPRNTPSGSTPHSTLPTPNPGLGPGPPPPSFLSGAANLHHRELAPWAGPSTTPSRQSPRGHLGPDRSVVGRPEHYRVSSSIPGLCSPGASGAPSPAVSTHCHLFPGAHTAPCRTEGRVQGGNSLWAMLDAV